MILLVNLIVTQMTIIDYEVLNYLLIQLNLNYLYCS